MKSFRLLVLLLISWLLAACEQTPDYTDTAGNSGAFADHHGQWLVINYWAIWCKPCIEEISELNQFAAQQQGNVVVFGVNFDGVDQATLVEQSATLNIQFPVLTQDPAPLLGLERPKVLPTTVVFNPAGKLHQILLGPQTLVSLQQAVE